MPQNTQGSKMSWVVWHTAVIRLYELLCTSMHAYCSTYEWHFWTGQAVWYADWVGSFGQSGQEVSLCSPWQSECGCPKCGCSSVNVVASVWLWLHLLYTWLWTSLWMLWQTSGAAGYWHLLSASELLLLSWLLCCMANCAAWCIWIMDLVYWSQTFTGPHR